MVKFEIFVGKHKLLTDPLGIAEHWGFGIRYEKSNQKKDIKEGNNLILWYEIEGVCKESIGCRNKIRTHTDNGKYTSVESQGEFNFPGTFEELEEWIQKWNFKWLENHQIYAINGDNCQMHVKDFLKTCGIAESTQNTDLANMVLGAGIGATVVGLAAIGFSILLRGKHN
jgi:hypothetical protein